MKREWIFLDHTASYKMKMIILTVFFLSPLSTTGLQMAGKLSRKQRKDKESKVIGILKVLRNQHATMNRKDFLQKLEEYQLRKAEYQREMKAAGQQPIDCEARVRVEIIGQEIVIHHKKTIDTLQEKIRKMEEITITNEVAMIQHNQKKEEKIAQLEKEKQEIQLKLMKKPVIIYRNSKLFSAESNKLPNPPTEDSELEKKDRIVKSLTKTIEEATEEKNEIKKQKVILKKEVEKLKKECEHNKIKNANIDITEYENKLREDIKRNCVILKDDFEVMWVS